MIDISIIIVNYNVRDYLISCIKSIFKESSKSLSIEIIVIDNNSNDNSVESLINDFPEIKLIINDKNEGFTKAVNLGVKSSKGKYLFILNPDTYFIDDSLSVLFELMEKNENIALLGPTMISPSGKIQQSYWRKATLINSLLSLIYLDKINRKKNYANESIDIIKKVETISGGAFFVRSFIFDLVDGFDQNFFWMEDNDFCLRISNLDYEIYCTSETKIIHYQGKSSENNWTLTIYNQIMSKIKYFNKHHSNLESKILKICILIISFFKALILAILIPLKKSYLNKLKGHLKVINNILFNN
jgi:GT2 family glycosyltransferase